jgi:beta-N-acetylhexosaminidase
MLAFAFLFGSLSAGPAGFGSGAAAYAQDPTPPPVQRYSEIVDALMQRMSVQQKVGQLLLVSFSGADASEQSAIADLITNYHVGGVQLRASAQNFTNRGDMSTPKQIADLANALQRLAIRGEAGIETPEAPEAPTRTPRPSSATVTPTLRIAAEPRSIPMFIGITQENDLASNIELPEVSDGVTQAPNAMALGATWKPQHALNVGRILGGELAQMGINLYFGPSLDVMDTPRPGTPGDLGTRVFGGDPYWVSQFGTAFLDGLRQGSRDRIAIVARNFPGLGASDRNASEEIPTVQKSLEQLRQSELLPFFALTQRPTVSETVVDGLQIAHIRYRGFQGNIRSSTRPVSLDPQAYQALLTLPELTGWRQNGGLTFSESLGARSVRRFYDVNETTFNAKRIAQEAFVAGNDVLVLGSFGLGATSDEQIAAVKEVAGFFASKYVDDPNFAARVDESVRRILTLKLRLYDGRFNLARALINPPAGALGPNDETNKIISTIARDSVTLLSPGLRDLSSAIPAPPNRDDSVIFITDDRLMQECARCEPYSAIAKTAMRDIAINLYGPNVTGQIEPDRAYAFSLGDLAEYNLLNAATLSITLGAAITPTVTTEGETPTPSPPTEAALQMRDAISASNWIVFSVLDLNNSLEASQAFRQFLANQADSFKDKRVVVFAFGAPYYLDATEVSKVTAYFGVYSRTPASLTAAVRVLFGEFPPAGFSPVSVDATRYMLGERTTPNPEQLIPLISNAVLTNTGSTPEPLALKIGDKLDLTAGPIFDRNGNPVPDGTEVLFVLNYPNEGVEQPRIPATTRNGLARITVPVERQGTLNITVESDQAKRSDTIRVNAAADTVSVERIQPTALPTDTPVPLPTVTVEPTPAPTPQPEAPAPIVRTSFSGFLLTLLLLAGVGMATFIVLSGFRRATSALRARGVLSTWIAGWLGYLLYALAVPGTGRLGGAFGWVGGPMVAGVIALVAFGFVTLIIRLQRHESA